MSMNATYITEMDFIIVISQNVWALKGSTIGILIHMHIYKHQKNEIINKPPLF